MAKRIVRNGNLNEKEKEYIRTNYVELRPAELAVRLGKPEHKVREFINEISPQVKKEFRRSELPDGVREDKQDKPPEDIVICAELRQKPEWKHLRKELTDEELIFFEESYKTLMDQFQGDVYPTEERQIIQSIKLEVFMHRSNRNRLQIEFDLMEIDRLIADEEAIPIVSRNDSRLMNLKSQKQSLISAEPAIARIYKEYGEQHSKLMQSLKATREGRVKQAADAKTNILGLLKEFQTEKFRREQSLSMEVHKFALNDEMRRLSEPHTYMDGEVDRPILNWETDLLDDEISPTNNIESDVTDANPEESSESPAV